MSELPNLNLRMRFVDPIILPFRSAPKRDFRGAQKQMIGIDAKFGMAMMVHMLPLWEGVT